MHSEQSYNKELTLADILGKVKLGYKKILICVVIGIILSALYTLYTPTTYTAEMQIVPAESSSASSSTISSILSFGRTTPASFTYFMVLLRSSRVASEIMKEKPMMTRLFEPKWFLDKNGQWRRLPPGKIELISNAIHSFFGRTFDNSPTSVYAVQKAISTHLKDKTGATTPDVVTLSWSARSPEKAQIMLADVVATADRMMRTEKEAELERSIRYMNERIVGMTEVEERSAIISKLVDTEIRLILLRSGAPYAVQFLDDSYASPVPTSPVPLLNISIGIFLGFIVGCAIAVTRR